MVDPSIFMGAKPKDSIPNPRPRIEITLTEKIKELTNKEGMNEDDPLRLILVGIADEIDRFKPLIASYGPDTGRLAAEAAATIMRQEARRLSGRVRWKIAALVALTVSLLTAGGVWAGWTLRGSIPAVVEGSAIPRAMAERFHYQNWDAQWDARQSLPSSKDGFRWVMVPFVDSAPKPPSQ